MSVLQDAGFKIDPRTERFINEWAREAEKEIQYELSLIQSLCVALLSSLLGAGWGILVAVVINAETDLIWWQWALVWVPIVVAALILVLGVPFYLRRARQRKQVQWEAIIKGKVELYENHLRLKDERETKTTTE